MIFLAQLIYRIFQLLSLVVVIQVVLSYFMSPFDPIRRTIDRFVLPFLRPIQRFVPPIQGLDLSPVILIILLQIFGAILRGIILSL